MIALAYCIWRPVSHGSLLYSAVALIFVTSVGLIVRDRITIPGWLGKSTTCLLIAAALGTLVGALNNNPGTLQQAVQWLIAPLVWSAFAASLTRASMPLVLKVTTVILGLSALLMLLYIAPRLGVPLTLPSEIADQQGAGLNDHLDSTAFRWYGLSSLAAGAPFLVVAATQKRDSWLPGRTIMIPSAVVAAVVSFYSGRRAVLLVVLLAVAVLPLVRRRRRTTDAYMPAAAAFTATAVMALLMFARSTVSAFLSPVISGLKIYAGTADTSSFSADDAVRADEARELLHWFMDSPLWGKGLGATTPGFWRSDERPWTFELQFHLALMNLGILGCALIMHALVTWCLTLRRVYHRLPQHAPSITATAIACIGLAIANLTNPYLQAVGHGWGVALSVGLLCACSRERETEGQASAPGAPVRAGNEKKAPAAITE